MCPTELYSPNVIVSPKVCQQSCDKGTLGLLRDAYGDARCLPACWHDAERGIRCVKVLASKTISVPKGGMRTLATRGRLVKDAPFICCGGPNRKGFFFFLLSLV